MRAFASPAKVGPSPKFDFAYPAPFSTGQYKPLLQSSKIPQVPTLTTVNAAQALNIYAASQIGAYHTGQPARYPSLHSDLMIDDIDAEELSTFRTRNLALLAPLDQSRAHEKGFQGYDLHPLGHMAIVASLLNEKLDGSLKEEMSSIDCGLVEALRHAAALHDVGEAMHPSLKEVHELDVIGDIGANVGKTPQDRVNEGKITRAVIGDTLQQQGVYSEKFAEMIVRLSNHETQGEGKDLNTVHAVLEGIHELNTVKTAVFMADRASAIAQNKGESADTTHAEIFLDLAKDTLKRSTHGPKLELAREHAPKVLVEDVTTCLSGLGRHIKRAEQHLVRL